MGCGVLVGMSGGVDSSVAAMLLKEQGHRVVGVTLKLWNDPLANGDRICCSTEAVHRAKRVAHQLLIPHLTVDATEMFGARVVQYFVDEYAGGRTPNPCSKCNARVRFAFMLEIARKLGLDKVATGHYARLVGEPAGLARGLDRTKDQSYVLAEVAPELLSQVVFPLGELTKVEVRALAAQAGLEGSGAAESQEICFIPADDYQRFLRDRLGDRPGAIIDQAGGPLGRHAGTYNFTIGQRKGLRIAGKTATYVVGLNAGRQEVVVGGAADLAIGGLCIRDVVLHRHDSGGRTSVQVRSAGGAVPGRMVGGETIVLEEPATGVAPGQTAVVYEGDSVIAAGTIVSTKGWSAPVTSEA
ncbi:MAG: tRNA 2-thiouridine(34) synthase MnmA [Actinobacteria bacterium RBG_16_64_13]|nr:MAG: tRNA 2-thiouridine(34) synthase MnmA [Actinobacteria bacterium RBG_16_64_13]